jgi:hypothetical protein
VEMPFNIIVPVPDNSYICRKIKKMVYTLEINDKGKTGKSILQLLRDLSKTNPDIHFLETVEDDELLEKMRRSLKSGKASRVEVNKTLKAITG